MIILDTSVWIEFLCARAPYAQRVDALLQLRQVLALPWVFGELLQGARAKREVKIITELWEALPKPECEFCEKAWILAGAHSQRERWIAKGVGLIDAAILAAALEFKAKVWTLDKNLGSLLAARKMRFDC